MKIKFANWNWKYLDFKLGVIRNKKKRRQFSYYKFNEAIYFSLNFSPGQCPPLPSYHTSRRTLAVSPAATFASNSVHLLCPTSLSTLYSGRPSPFPILPLPCPPAAPLTIAMPPPVSASCRPPPPPQSSFLLDWVIPRIPLNWFLLFDCHFFCELLWNHCGSWDWK